MKRLILAGLFFPVISIAQEKQTPPALPKKHPACQPIITRLEELPPNL
ncbi:MAG: hypothetical protein ACKO1T_01360 [Sediminibacterium sp.]